MRHFDLTPLYRSTIGFDRLGSLLDSLGSFEAEVMLRPCMTNEGTNSTALTLSLLPGMSIASPSFTV